MTTCTYLLGDRVEHVRGDADDHDRDPDRVHHLDVVAPAPGDVVAVHHLGQPDVRVGVEPALDELLALVGEVRLDVVPAPAVDLLGAAAELGEVVDVGRAESDGNRIVDIR